MKQKDHKCCFLLCQVRFPGGRPQPSKPLFFYLVPLVRIQGLLPQLQQAIEGEALSAPGLNADYAEDLPKLFC